MNSTQLRPRNPDTRREHERETLWQITLPLILGGGLLLLLFVGVLVAASGGSAEVGRWAGVSMIWLVATNLLFVFSAALVVGGLTYLIFLLIGWLPGAMYQLHFFLRKCHAVVVLIGNKSVEPFLRLHSLSASAWAFKKSLFGQK